MSPHDPNVVIRTVLRTIASPLFHAISCEFEFNADLHRLLQRRRGWWCVLKLPKTVWPVFPLAFFIRIPDDSMGLQGVPRGFSGEIRVQNAL